MKKVSGSLKLLYSQYIELKSFSQFGSDLDTDTKTRLAQGERIVEVLKQDRNHPIDVAHQIAIIYAVTNNMLMDIEVSDIGAFEDGLFSYMNSHCVDIIDEIHNTGVMSNESTAKLAEAINQYKATFLNSK